MPTRCHRQRHVSQPTSARPSSVNIAQDKVDRPKDGDHISDELVAHHMGSALRLLEEWARTLKHSANQPERGGQYPPNWRNSSARRADVQTGQPIHGSHRDAA
jgi:hypothetical protein